jgi:hypothetical protein
VADASKPKATLLKVAGIACGFVLITIGMIAAPRIGNWSMLIVLAGFSTAVLSYVIATLRSSKS